MAMDTKMAIHRFEVVAQNDLIHNPNINEPIACVDGVEMFEIEAASISHLKTELERLNEYDKIQVAIIFGVFDIHNEYHKIKYTDFENIYDDLNEVFKIDDYETTWFLKPRKEGNDENIEN